MVGPLRTRSVTISVTVVSVYQRTSLCKNRVPPVPISCGQWECVWDNLLILGVAGRLPVAPGITSQKCAPSGRGKKLDRQGFFVKRRTFAGSNDTFAGDYDSWSDILISVPALWCIKLGFILRVES